jgi:hypothetical protein
MDVENSVDMGTGYGLNGRDLIQEQFFFSFMQHPKPSVALTSYLMGTGCSFSGIKAAQT